MLIYLQLPIISRRKSSSMIELYPETRGRVMLAKAASFQNPHRTKTKTTSISFVKMPWTLKKGAGITTYSQFMFRTSAKALDQNSNAQSEFSKDKDLR